MFRAAVVAGLLGLAVAIALPVLGLSMAGTGALVAGWWSVVLVAAGLRGLLPPRRVHGPLVPAVIAALGVAILVGHLLHLAAGPLVLAVLLLAVGLRLAGVRLWPKGMGRLGGTRLAGTVQLGGPDWRIENGSLFQFVGEIRLDLTGARLPEGTTALRIGMLAGEVTIDVPADLAVRARAKLRAGEIEMLEHRAEGIGPMLTVESDDYAGAGRRVDFDIDVLAGEIRLRRRG